MEHGSWKLNSRFFFCQHFTFAPSSLCGLQGNFFTSILAKIGCPSNSTCPGKLIDRPNLKTSLLFARCYIYNKLGKLVHVTWALDIFFYNVFTLYSCFSVHVLVYMFSLIILSHHTEVKVADFQTDPLPTK